MFPPRVILAPVDFSDGARTALALAARFAQQAGAGLHVLYAEEPLLAEAARHEGIDLARDADEELRRFIDSAPPAAQTAPERHAIAGAPVDAIIDAARRLRADLIVIGSRGMSGAERLVFGSTTEGVLRRTPLSVLVTPSEWTPPSPQSAGLSGVGPVIAAVDFSPASVVAARAACRLASAIGSRAEVVHVVPELSVVERWRSHAATVARDRAAAARTELDAMVRALACTVPVEAKVETGAVANRLANLAAPDGSRSPLLVLGRRASGERGEAPGAIAYRTLTLAKAPVLMYAEG